MRCIYFEFGRPISHQIFAYVHFDMLNQLSMKYFDIFSLLESTSDTLIYWLQPCIRQVHTQDLRKGVLWNWHVLGNWILWVAYFNEQFDFQYLGNRLLTLMTGNDYEDIPCYSSNCAFTTILKYLYLSCKLETWNFENVVSLLTYLFPNNKIVHHLRAQYTILSVILSR